MDGISFIPKIGIHTQKIPPITSVKDKSVNSAAGIDLDPIEYSIKPRQTNVPCNANKLSFLPDDKKFKSFCRIIASENKKQNKPARATVVNLGVSFLHLNETEKTENPTADARPNIKPLIDSKDELPKAIIATPMDATNIAIHTLNGIFSFKNKKPNKAVIKGIAAKHNNVIATVVFVMDQIKVIFAVPSPIPPINPDIPIFK